jgi:L-cysteine desulfidase
VESDKLLELLHAQVIPAVGCTEPVSIAIATAAARQHVAEPITDVQVEISLNIFKNGMRVGIPGTEEKGIPFATALALVLPDPVLGLEIFAQVDAQHIAEAKRLLAQDIIHIRTADNDRNFYVSVQVTGNSDKATCVIESNHTNIVSITRNGEIIQGHCVSPKDQVEEVHQEIPDFDTIFSFAEEVDPAQIAFLLDGVTMNLAIAKAGKEQRRSSGLGPRLYALMEMGKLPDDMVHRIRACTAAACDARMGGVNLPVMSSSGSGNQGITAIIPIAVLASELGSSDAQLSRALAISHLVTSFIKQKTGRLSPVCGCAVAAGIGAAAGMTFLQGGSRHTMRLAINNMIGSLAGLVCDGAKGGCAYKLATAASEAYIQSLVAQDETSVSAYDGIVGASTEATVENLGQLCTEGMGQVDSLLVDILSGYRVPK